MKQSKTSIYCAALVAALVVMTLRDRAPESQAQTQPPPAASEIEPLREAIGNFFENMSDPNKGPAKAAEDFLKNSSLMDNEKTKTRIAEGLRTISQNFGAYVSYEQIGMKTVGSDLIVFRYLYKRQDYPVVWYFTYYRPRAKGSESASSSSSWTLIGFRYDTNLDSALLDATFDSRN